MLRRPPARLYNTHTNTHKTTTTTPVTLLRRGSLADTQTGMLPEKFRKRNVRSKFRWFTRFCNSHHVSHFAAFFIIVGAKTSVAENCCANYTLNSSSFQSNKRVGYGYTHAHTEVACTHTLAHTLEPYWFQVLQSQFGWTSQKSAADNTDNLLSASTEYIKKKNCMHPSSPAVDTCRSGNGTRFGRCQPSARRGSRNWKSDASPPGHSRSGPLAWFRAEKAPHFAKTC